MLAFLYCRFEVAIKAIVLISLVYFLALCACGYGRIFNDGYLTFRCMLESALTAGQTFVPHLRQYDFEFSFWPIEYQWLIKENRFLPSPSPPERSKLK